MTSRVGVCTNTKKADFDGVENPPVFQMAGKFVLASAFGGCDTVLLEVGGNRVYLVVSRDFASSGNVFY